MSLAKTVLVSVLATALVWGVFSWPLPRHALSGIPSSSTNVEQGDVRRMIMGDHLQVLYHYWLSADSLTGHTEPFCNPYEFNTGTDEDRKYFGFDNAFFSAVFTLGYLAGGRAAGWNLTVFVSLLLTYLFTWLLLRNYTPNRWLPPVMAVIAIALPYRWHTLMGGSPSGLAMAWVPMLLWGLDALIRRNSLMAGTLAGLAVFFAYWNDMYVFFFCVLMGPCWVAFVLLHDDRFPWTSRANWRRVVTAALPMAVLLVAIAVLAMLKHADVAAVEADAGRDSWRDVMICSPYPAGLTAWRAMGYDSFVYLGVVAPLVLLVGLVAQATLFVRGPRANGRRTACFLLLILGIAGIAVLALGARGPMNGRFFSLVRDHLPPYALVRQPAKVFSLLPPLLALAMLLAATAVERLVPRFPTAFRVVLPVAILLAVVEYKCQVRPMVCLLDTEQQAYRAVAEDARTRAGREPHVLVLPIWPGNSAWASLYEHYVSLYRIRMLNGYLPAVPRSYIEQVYQVFDSCTSGAISDDQLVRLADMGVQYVILHENAFPEQVGSFPVAFTIKRLMNHPRLELLKQDRSVWAFRVLADAVDRPPRLAHWDRFFPVGNALRECEWYAPTNAVVVADTNAAGDRFVRLDAASAATLPVPVYLSRIPDAVLQVRVAGRGELAVSTIAEDRTNTQAVAVEAPDWTWLVIPLPLPSRDVEAVLEFRPAAGAVDLDMLLTAVGPTLLMRPGERISLPAPLFFHAGYTDLERDAVVLRAETEQDGEPFYGPNLPLAPGRHRLRLGATSDAPAGSPLGSLSVVCGDAAFGPFPVTAGADTLAEFTIPRKNLPVRIAFDYTRRADVVIERVVLERLD